MFSLYFFDTLAKETNRTFNSTELLETRRVVAQNTEETEIRYFGTYTRSNLNYTGAKRGLGQRLRYSVVYRTQLRFEDGDVEKQVLF